MSFSVQTVMYMDGVLGLLLYSVTASAEKQEEEKQRAGLSAADSDFTNAVAAFASCLSPLSLILFSDLPSFFFYTRGK